MCHFSSPGSIFTREKELQGHCIAYVLSKNIDIKTSPTAIIKNSVSNKLRQTKDKGRSHCSIF